MGLGPLGLAQLQGLGSGFGISQSGFHTAGPYERGGFHGAVVLKMAGMNEEISDVLPGFSEPSGCPSV